jgi:hypothetical protein
MVMTHDRIQITRINKAGSKRIWVEISIAFETVPFRDPLQALPTTEHFADIQAWCTEHACGTRMSYDQFSFRNEKELNMFMLRWA